MKKIYRKYLVFAMVLLFITVLLQPYTLKKVFAATARANVKVTSVKLNKTVDTLAVGGTDKLTATINPSNASNKAVTWKSSNTNVVVDNTGKITAKKAGTSTIKVTTIDGSKTATCTVTVITKVTGVSLNKTKDTLAVGSTDRITATIAPSNASNKAVTWKSSNIDVATVDSTGKITAKKVGIATIKITTIDGNKTATCTVTVIAKVASVSLNKTTDTLMVGGSDRIAATIAPSNASNKAVTWKSSNIDVATVDSTGKITAKKVGTAIITVTTADGNKTAFCTVTVKSQSQFTINQLPLNITIENPDSIGNVYMKATYKNNSQKNIIGFSATILLKNTNEKVYLSNYNTVLPGETSPNFETFGPKTQNKNDIQILKYEVLINNGDGTETEVVYDCKLNTYDVNNGEIMDFTKKPAVTMDQLPMNISIQSPDSIGNVYMNAAYINKSQKNIVGYTAIVLLKDTNEITYLSNYDTVVPGETSSSFETFGPKTQNAADIQVLGYEITIANADGTQTQVVYDCKLKQYKQY